jgi:phage-related tail fiber protein
MSNTFRIKRRASGSPGAPSTLANAELAFNEVDDILYYGKGTGGAGGSATTIDAIAGKGAVVMLTGSQTISGAKTYSTVPIIPTVTLSDSSTNAASTAFVKGQGYMTGNQTITFTGDATGSGTTSVTLTLANTGVTAGTYTKVTVDAKGRVTTGTTIQSSDISDFNTAVRLNRLEQLTSPTGTVSMGSQIISNVATPVNATDAANKQYVDSARSGLDVKASVRVATTGNITLSGTQTIDGVALVVGDRVLVKDQTTSSQNGPYLVASGSWTRTTDANDSTSITPGLFCFIEEGTTNADTGWVLTNNGSIVVDTTGLVFSQFTGVGSLTASNGIAKTGNNIALSDQALALHNLSTNGFITRTGSGTVASRTISSNSSSLTITDGDGIAANPVFTLSSAINLIGSVTPASDTLVYYAGTSSAVSTTFTSFARSLVAAASASAARTVLGLGTLSTQDSSAVNITGGSITGLTTFDNITIDGGTF